MAFSDLDTRAINHVFTGPFVTSLSYTPEDGDASSIPVLYSLTDNPFEDGRYLGKGMIAWIRASDIATPATGDTITLGDGEIYTVRGVNVSYDGAIWKLNLTARMRASA